MPDISLSKLFERNVLVGVLIAFILGFGAIGGFLAVIYKEQTSYATKFTDNLITSVDKLREEIREMNKINTALRIEVATQKGCANVAATIDK